MLKTLLEIVMGRIFKFFNKKQYHNKYIIPDSDLLDNLIKKNYSEVMIKDHLQEINKNLIRMEKMLEEKQQ